MAETVYLLCALTSLACAFLLWRAYRRSRTRLLLWSALCFGCLAANNVLLVVDLVVLPEVQGIEPFRTPTALVGLLLLIFGMIWDGEAS